MSSLHQSPPATPRVLVACVGNIFFGDDGFGTAVAERLRDRTYPAGVDVGDFGIRGHDLAYTLLDGYETVVLVDATPRGGAPGTLYLIEPDLASGGASGAGQADQGLGAGQAALDAHSMDPQKVLAFAHALGARPRRILLVGCEPAASDGDADQMRMELSEPVQGAVDEAARMIDRLVAELCAADTDAAQERS